MKKGDKNPPALMVCPECQKLTRAKIARLWRNDSGEYILRRRVCGCPLRRTFSTYEFPGDYGKLLVTLDKLIRRYVEKQYGFELPPAVKASEAPVLTNLDDILHDGKRVDVTD